MKLSESNFCPVIMDIKDTGGQRLAMTCTGKPTEIRDIITLAMVKVDAINSVADLSGVMRWNISDLTDAICDFIKRLNSDITRNQLELFWVILNAGLKVKVIPVYNRNTEDDQVMIAAFHSAFIMDMDPETIPINPCDVSDEAAAQFRGIKFRSMNDRKPSSQF